MRYLGPVFKKARRYGISILENEKEFSKGKKRTYCTLGQHGNKRCKTFWLWFTLIWKTKS
nr:hypothetical protein [Mycoplasmopsis bovis]